MIYFATNRQPDDGDPPKGFGGRFSADGLANLRFGEAEVTGDDIDGLEVYRETPDGSHLGSTQLFKKLQKRMRQGSPHTVIFIHGFNVTFKGALLHGAQLQKIYSHIDRPALNLLIFSWPSDGTAVYYDSDRHDAAASGYAVARGLEKAVLFLRELHASLEEGEGACAGCIHLMVHSMGCYLLRHALQAMIDHGVGVGRLTGRGPAHLDNSRPVISAPGGLGLPRLFDQIILTAADEDKDAFEHPTKLARLPELCNRLTVYFNQGDRALTISDWTKGNPDRLGSSGPLSSRLNSKIEVVDCTPVVPGVVEHGYHAEVAKVRDDIRDVLVGKPGDKCSTREWMPSMNHYRLR